MNKKKFRVKIHASNVAGLGSMSVVSSLIKSKPFLKYCEVNDVQIYLPRIKFWLNNFRNIPNLNIIYVKRFKSIFFRFIFRVFNLLIGDIFFYKCNKLIVLGDFPFRFKGNQILLLHNTHLIETSIKFNKYTFHRFIFRINHKFVNTCIVQSEVVKNKLISSYPYFKDKCEILAMPVNDIYNRQYNKQFSINGKFSLFYPGSFYKHKNHQILVDLFNIPNFDKLNNIQISLTINRTDFLNLKNIRNIHEDHFTFLGVLNESQILQNYINTQALIFPSLNESFGLPLLEAMKLKKIIICADLPYSRWLCGNEAIYFDPYDPFSLYSAIDLAINNYNKGLQPNWTNALSKIPQNWDIYGKLFLDII